MASSLRAQTHAPLVIGYSDSLYSNILKEPRQLWVYVPSDIQTHAFAPQRYPVLYLLDGDAHFSSVVGMMQQLTRVNGNNLFPEMIVVGIANTDRTRDLTPTHIFSDPPFMGPVFSRTTGGGENFLAFIEKELMPYVEANYPTQPYKMLIGHSFGGLTVMQCLTRHTQLFNAYICIDPSMWWDKERFLESTKKALKEPRYEGISLYLGYANTMEDEKMTIKQVQTDTSEESRHIRSIIDLEKFLKKQKNNGLRFDSKYYENDDHGSVPLITEYDGLRFIFDYYPLKMKQKDMQDTTMATVRKIGKHYQMVSAHFGYEVHPPELQINNLGYQALGRRQFAKAGYLFKWNVENYPQSANVYDSYGDYFVAVGDKANAIAQFQKALTLKEVEETRRKLDELQGKR